MSSVSDDDVASVTHAAEVVNGLKSQVHFFLLFLSLPPSPRSSSPTPGGHDGFSLGAPRSGLRPRVAYAYYSTTTNDIRFFNIYDRIRKNIYTSWSDAARVVVLLNIGPAGSYAFARTDPGPISSVSRVVIRL